MFFAFLALGPICTKKKIVQKAQTRPQNRKICAKNAIFPHFRKRITFFGDPHPYICGSRLSILEVKKNFGHFLSFFGLVQAFWTIFFLRPTKSAAANSKNAFSGLSNKVEVGFWRCEIFCQKSEKVLF